MKEILIIGVGSSGIKLTTSYISLMAQEHNLAFHQEENNPSQGMSVHFRGKEGSIVARSLVIDQDSFSTDRMLAHPEIQYFHPDNILSENQLTSGLYAHGYYSTQLLDQIQEAISKEISHCDSLQGIILNHSTMGGTGSGLGAKLTSLISEQYPDKILVNNIILPCMHTSETNFNQTTLSIYNTIFSLHSLTEYSNLTIMSDNEALFENTNEISSFNFNEAPFFSINKRVSKTISGLTSSSRFSGINSGSLRKIVVNAIVFPRLHFFSSNHFEENTPQPEFLSRCKEKVRRNIGCSMKFPTGEFSSMTYAGFFRGNNFSSSEIEEFNKDPICKAYNWVPAGILTHASNPRENSEEATILNLGAQFGDYLEKLSNKFSHYFRRKSFVFWYTNAGMDEMEFTEAESNVNDLMSEINWSRTGMHNFEEDWEDNSVLS